MKFLDYTGLGRFWDKVKAYVAPIEKSANAGVSQAAQATTLAQTAQATADAAQTTADAAQTAVTALQGDWDVEHAQFTVAGAVLRRDNGGYEAAPETFGSSPLMLLNRAEPLVVRTGPLLGSAFTPFAFYDKDKKYITGFTYPAAPFMGSIGPDKFPADAVYFAVSSQLIAGTMYDNGTVTERQMQALHDHSDAFVASEAVVNYLLGAFSRAPKEWSTTAALPVFAIEGRPGDYIMVSGTKHVFFGIMYTSQLNLIFMAETPSGSSTTPVFVPFGNKPFAAAGFYTSPQ